MGFLGAGAADDSAAAGPSTSGAGAGAGSGGGDVLAALRAENAALRARLDAVAAAALPAELAGADLERLALGGDDGDDRSSDGGGASGSGGAGASGSGGAGGSGAGGGDAASAPAGGRGIDVAKGRRSEHALGIPSGSGGAASASASAGAGDAASAAAAAAAAAVDAAYFGSYAFFDIHREMLGDAARTEAYRAALEDNPTLVRGARVLDVGCGTGILSMFAARGGAAAVVGLDGSERIAGFARQVRQGGGAEKIGADTLSFSSPFRPEHKPHPPHLSRCGTLLVTNPAF